MSNRPTPPKKPSNNPLIKFLSTIVNFITNPRLANFAQIYPFLIPSLVGLITFILGLNSSGFFHSFNPQDKDFQKQVCQTYEKNVTKRLQLEGKVEGKTYDWIETSFEDNKNNSDKNLLPFSCEYTIIKGTTELESKKNSIELNPLFPDLINDINDDFEKEIKMENVCDHETIKKQMEELSTDKGDYKKENGDRIVPGKPEFLTSKKEVYPVFRWVCNYKIIKKQTRQKPILTRSEDKIDLRLEDYCIQKAKDEGNTGRVKPTHHNYRDPYSLYCVNPTSPNN
ncbi:hypothetical protein NIES4073_41010 [Kalymmatonema gypsitolerans NIES-4073]|nr:hypothetical protein NIES4073_41010 [Scytonema sp. NIES-4073]